MTKTEHTRKFSLAKKDFVLSVDNPRNLGGGDFILTITIKHFKSGESCAFDVTLRLEDTLL